VKGVEFIVYRNRIFQQIKDRWTWIGKRSDLEVTVRFGIQDNGEVFGLKITQSSGDASFDSSVLRAVRNASPLGSPPEPYRADFRDVEIIFRPKDLRS
ncbi:MAG: energy transducer TonB, partial [Candidatus Binatia bacterium]